MPQGIVVLEAIRRRQNKRHIRLASASVHPGEACAWGLEKRRTLQRNAYGFRDEQYFTLRIYSLDETKYALVG
jgi:hypothetical protein